MFIYVSDFFFSRENSINIFLGESYYEFDRSYQINVIFSDIDG